MTTADTGPCLRQRGRSRTTVSYGFAAICASALAIYEVAFAAQYWRALPFWDHWDAVHFYQAWTLGKLPFGDIVAVANGHRILLTRLALVIDFALFEGRCIFAHILLLSMHIGLGAAIGLLATGGRPLVERALATSAGIAFLLAPIQIENVTRPYNIQFVASALFALGAFYWTARLADAETTKRARAARVVMASASIVLAVYSSANGLAAAAMAAAISFALPIGRITRSIIALVACLSIAGYFADYRSQMLDDGMRASLASWEDLLHFVIFIATFLGAVEQKGLVTTIGFGLVGFAFWSALTFLTIRLHLQSRQLDLNAIVLLLLATFAIATAAMTAIGRAGMGAEQAMSSRYGTWTVLFWISLGGAASRLPYLAGASGIKMVMISLGIWFFSLNYLLSEQFVGRLNTHIQAIDSASAALKRGRDIDDQSLAYISPDTVSIIPLIEFLRERRLSIFAD